VNYIQIHNPWLIIPKPNPQAKLRLFCFPYAGGGAAIFKAWHKELNPKIEVCAVQLPGRENRLSEPAFNRLQPLIEAISQAILPNLNQPFAFFGHSMGGLICFELASYLRRIYNLTPVHLFISAASAPHIPDTKPPIHNLPQIDFLEELRRFNGTPNEVLENQELMELISPTLRADFGVLETYIYSKSPPLSCAITAFGGITDPEVSQTELAAWQEHTTGEFSLQMLPGNHFFIHENRLQLLDLLSQHTALYI
jgi:medium-chain acyl-[acyl-carrier-protein] hydrolase